MASRKEKDLEYLKKASRNHVGKWLTEEVVVEYQALAAKISDSNNQMIGEKRKLCIQLMNEYGLTEMEALNILNGHRAYDYIAKYERIRTLTPLYIKKDTPADTENDKD